MNGSYSVRHTSQFLARAYRFVQSSLYIHIIHWDFNPMSYPYKGVLGQKYEGT